MATDTLLQSLLNTYLARQAQGRLPSAREAGEGLREGAGAAYDAGMRATEAYLTPARALGTAVGMGAEFLGQQGGEFVGGLTGQPKAPPQLPQAPQMAPTPPQQPQGPPLQGINPLNPLQQGPQAPMAPQAPPQSAKPPWLPPQLLAQQEALERAKRLADVDKNIGPGAREFAPNQFYKGPERVGGAARRDSFSNNAGSVNLPPTSSGRGTLSMAGIQDDEGNLKEILPSNPVAQRNYLLQKAQQQARIEQADATRKAYKSGAATQGEPQPVQEQAAALVLQGLIAAANTGQITPEQFRESLSNLIQQLHKNYDPFAAAYSAGAATQSE